MFDSTNYTPAGAEPPTPTRRHWDPIEHEPVFLYAIKGPDGWYSAVVEKEAIPGAYTLTVQDIDTRRYPLFRGGFSSHRGRLAYGDALYRTFDELLGDIVHCVTGDTSGWSMTRHPVPLDAWISLCEDGRLHGQTELVWLCRPTR
jgi:hypothetical protein